LFFIFLETPISLLLVSAFVFNPLLLQQNSLEVITPTTGGSPESSRVTCLKRARITHQMSRIVTPEGAYTGPRGVRNCAAETSGLQDRP
jgi:hypothetical protein